MWPISTLYQHSHRVREQRTAEFAVQWNKWCNKEPPFYVEVSYSDLGSILLSMEQSCSLESLGTETEREEEIEVINALRKLEEIGLIWLALNNTILKSPDNYHC